jgi:hypothetical protein
VASRDQNNFAAFPAVIPVPLIRSVIQTAVQTFKYAISHSALAVPANQAGGLYYMSPNIPFNDMEGRLVETQANPLCLGKT